MEPADAGGPTAAVVALKAGEFAKSRLAPLPDPLRRRLAWTMALDTLQALSAAVDRVLVVSRQPSLASRLQRSGVVVDVLGEVGRAGMNAALSQGDDLLRDHGTAVVLACVGDLPSLRADSVRRILAASRSHFRCFVPDASGVGTTMLLSRDGELDPRFQGRSAAAHHASGATRLEPGPADGSLADARRDVDTEVDLADASHLGLGPATAALLVGGTGRLGTYRTVTATAWTSADAPGVDMTSAGTTGADDDATGVAVTSTGHRVLLPTAALGDGLRTVHPGQRLHAVLDGERVLSAWL